MPSTSRVWTATRYYSRRMQGILCWWSTQHLCAATRPNMRVCRISGFGIVTADCSFSACRRMILAVKSPVVRMTSTRSLRANITLRSPYPKRCRSKERTPTRSIAGPPRSAHLRPHDGISTNILLAAMAI